MDLWTALRTIRRHWLVLIVGLCLTVAVLLILDTRIQQRYSATGTVVVISPGGNTNPIDVYSSSSSLAANVATTLGNDDNSKAAVAARGGTSDYNLVTDPSLPVITITTTAPDPLTAVRSFSLVSQQINQLLRDRQQAFSSPPATTLEVLAVTSPTSAKVTSYKLTVLLLAAVLGGLFAIAGTFIADSAEQRRLRRPRTHATAADEPAVAKAARTGLDDALTTAHTSSRPARKTARGSVSPKPAAESTAQVAVAQADVAQPPPLSTALPEPDTVPSVALQPVPAHPSLPQPVPAQTDAESDAEAKPASVQAASPTPGHKGADPEEPPTFQLPMDVMGERRPLSAPSYAEFMAAPTSTPEQPDSDPTVEAASPARARPITARRHPSRPR